VVVEGRAGHPDPQHHRDQDRHQQLQVKPIDLLFRKGLRKQAFSFSGWGARATAGGNQRAFTTQSAKKRHARSPETRSQLTELGVD